MSTIDAERVNKKILNREPDCCAPLGELKRSSDKTIFYQLPLPSDGLPVPYPESFTDCPFSTDSSQSMEFVEMPFSLSNSSRNQISQEASHWSEIVRHLTDTPILTTRELIDAIKACNSTYKKRNFNVLRRFMEDHLTDEEKDYFFEETLPKIIELVIQLPKLIRQPIPILKQKVNHSLYFSQQQIASLIANGFFCTFKDKVRTPKSKLLDINLIRLYVEKQDFRVGYKILKLSCIFNYFRRVTKEVPKGTVTFERRFLQPDEIPKWHKSDKNLTKIVIKSDAIEKKGKGLLQVNSTYQLIGADFLNSDCNSQMISSFLAYPELLMLRLFTELMLNNESLLIVGVEKFNRRSVIYEDYLNCVDKTQTDEWGRRYTKLLALDAKYFAWDKISNQYKKSYIDRELNKAYSGFMDRSKSGPKHRCAIATGKWGCFNKRGDPQLKSLIQLLAASQAERDLMFCALKDIKLADELKEIKKMLIEKGLSVSQLYKILCRFGESLETEYPKGLLFPYLTQQLSTSNEEN